ncbi:FCD domain-containing protein [Streptomyces griseoluteus]|uniref:FCD domain-containing protein n=1 Tax=Streptomyces griseoluteus TaxID=29306 RepID=UPI0036F5C1AE
MLQIVEVRAVLEGEAAALAATRATQDGIARIRLAPAALDTAVAADGDDVDEDLAFHRTLAESTGNPVLVRTVRHLAGARHTVIYVIPGNPWNWFGHLKGWCLHLIVEDARHP